MNSLPELAVVIPVYNEEAHIASLIQDWQQLLERNSIQHIFIMINDGSTDDTASILSSIESKTSNVNVHTQLNCGHGPSIWKGYQLSLNASWVFQIDADHQYESDAFEILWSNRNEFDLLIGERIQKNASNSRNFVSYGSRQIIRHLFGESIRDVNSPYRLIRADRLKEALSVIPENSFAPNLMMSGFFMVKKMRIFTEEIHLRNERLPNKSIMSKHLFIGALKAFFQTISFRLRL